MNKNIQKVTNSVQYNFNIYDGQMSDEALEIITKTVIADLHNWEIEDIAKFFDRYLEIDDEVVLMVEPMGTTFEVEKSEK